MTFYIGVSGGQAGKDGKSWEVIGIVFLCVQRKKGKQQGIKDVYWEKPA